jgi:hypothetical protein
MPIDHVIEQPIVTCYSDSNVTGAKASSILEEDGSEYTSTHLRSPNAALIYPSM